MRHETETDERASSAGPCIWMTAGLVAYKLCDREYDCENCPLDAALRGEAGSPPSAFPRRPAASAFPSDRLYHPTHLWVRDLGRRRVRCGLDALAARLLSHITSIVLPLPGSKLERGRPACWMRDSATVVPLRAPVQATVRRVNGRLREDACLAVEEPYDRGWLFELRCDLPLERQPELCRAAAQADLVHREWEEIEAKVAGWLAEERSVGVTLADGGERQGDLRRILGVERYARLVRSVLC